MTVRHIEASRPRRLGWGVGLLLVFVTIQVGVVLPAAAVFLLGGGRRLAVPAMVGGLLAAWVAFTAGLRAGRHRGWWV
jgi:hypothetical protein